MDDEARMKGRGAKRGVQQGHRLVVVGMSSNAFKKRDFGARPGKGHVWPPEGSGHRGCACGHRAQRAR